MASGEEMKDSQPYQPDDHILCDDCDKLYKGDCPEHGPLEWIKTTRAVDSTQYNKSIASLPDGLLLKESGIPDNDMGVFAARLIYKRTMFGPYEGQRVTPGDVPKGKELTFSWDLLQNGIARDILDGSDEKHSNWMRYVTYARDKREQNLIAFQYQGQIFYRTFRDVYPGEELMIWYEDEYSCTLDELPEEFSQGQVPEFGCQRCRFVFAGATYLYKHHKFRCPDGPLVSTYGARTTGLVGALFRLPVAIANESCSNPVANSKSSPDQDRHHCRRKRKPRKLPRPPETEEAWNPEQPFGPPLIDELTKCEADVNQNKATLVMLPPEAQALDAENAVVDGVVEQEDYENYRKRLSSVDVDPAQQEKKQRFDDGSGTDDNKYPYHCGECGKSFARPTWWAKHESGCRKKTSEASAKTTNDSNNKCAIGKNSFSPVEAQSEVKKSVRKEPYKCDYCHKTFACPSWKRRHEKVHLKRLQSKSKDKLVTPVTRVTADTLFPHICADCGKGFSVVRWLTRHRAAHHPNSKSQPKTPLSMRTHVCRDCGRGFGVAAWLTRHRMTAHRNKFSKRHICGVCGRSFSMAVWLTRHMKTHEDPGLVAASATTISTAGTTEGKKKAAYKLPWVCGDCGRSYRFISWLQRHQKNNRHKNGYCNDPKVENSGSSTFACDHEGCGKTFPTKRQYRKHQGKHLSHEAGESARTTGPPFICPKENCGKMFQTKRMFTRHKDKHAKLPDTSRFVGNKSTCEVCGKAFSTTDLLERHGKRIHGKTFKVQTSNDTDNLKNPASDGATHLCKYCDKEFSHPLLLQRHMKTHRKNKQVGETFTKEIPHGIQTEGSTKESTTELERKSFDPRYPYECGQCDRVFASYAWLSRHTKEHKRSDTSTATNSSPDKQHPYKCDQCVKAFTSKAWLSRHQREHERVLETPTTNSSPDKQHPYKCDQCVKAFTSKAWLSRHQREHERVLETPATNSSPDKQHPHKCNQCDRAFASLAWLRRHQKEHARVLESAATNDSIDTQHPHKCVQCDRAFASLAWLRRHQREHERALDSTSTNESKYTLYPYKCDQCERAFASPQWLSRHLKEHGQTNELATNKSPDPHHPYKCDQCVKAFTSQAWLSRHQRVHERALESAATNDTTDTQKPYKCDECGKAFTVAGWLTKHKKEHEMKLTTEDDEIPTSPNSVAVSNDPKLQFKCDECGKAFAFAVWLTKHKKEHEMKSTANEDEIPTSPNSIAAPHDPKHPYKCDECGKAFAVAFWLTRHKKEHEMKSTTKEDEIPTSPNSVAAPHDPKHPFKCDECGKAFAVAFWLTRHKRGHATPVSASGEVPEDKPVPIMRGNSKVYACKDCGLEFSWPSWLLKHRKLHKPRTFTGVQPPPPKKQKTVKKLKKTPKETNPISYKGMKASSCFEMVEENGIKQYRCKICKKTTVWHTGIVYHIRVHHTFEKPFKCRVCFKDFHMAGDLTKHARKHSGEKPFYCQYCKKRFTTSQQARRHAVIHSTELPFACKYCGKRYRDRSSVWRHIANQSCPNADQIPPKVPKKSKASGNTSTKSTGGNSDSALPKDKDQSNPVEKKTEKPSKKSGQVSTSKTHTKAKKLSHLCKNCNKTFPNLETFKSHIESYKNLEQIVCEYCGKCWVRTADLKRHLRVHTGERPYLCPDCGLGFKVSDALKRHMVKLHPTSTKKMVKVKSEPATPAETKVFEVNSNQTEEVERVAQDSLSNTPEKVPSKPPSRRNSSSSVIRESVQEEITEDEDEIPTYSQSSDEAGSETEACVGEEDVENLNQTTTQTKMDDYVTKITKKEPGDEQDHPKPSVVRKGTGKSTCNRKCEFCAKVFSAPGNLARHRRLHTGEKPFDCTHCGKFFMRTDLLAHHIAKYHGSD